MRLFAVWKRMGAKNRRLGQPMYMDMMGLLPGDVFQICDSEGYTEAGYEGRYFRAVSNVHVHPDPHQTAIQAMEISDGSFG